jgi:hypothetical protein
MRINLSQREWIYPAVILVAGFVYYVSYFNYGISLSDEGFFVYGAERVLRGQLPMSDFISYPPGSYFLLALLFKIFGIHLLVSRLMEMAFLILNGIMLFYIGKRLMPDRMALIPSFVLIAFPGPWHKVFFTFGLLLPLVALFRFLEKESPIRILVVGWCLGTVSIFKLESALFALIAVFVVLFCQHVNTAQGFIFNKRRILGFLRDSLSCFLALVSVILPFLLYYYLNSSLKALFCALKANYGAANIGETAALFGKPSLVKIFSEFHIGRLDNLFFHLFVLLYLLVLGKIVHDFFAKRGRDFLFLLSILIAGGLSLTYAYNFFGKSHLFQSAAMAYILFGYLIYTLFEKKKTISKAGVIILLFLLGLYVVDGFKWRNHFYSGSISRLYAVRKEGAREISSPKGRVYVGKRESDILQSLINFFEGKNGYLLPLYYDPMVNFLTGLENPTKYSILFPSFFKAEGKQKQVIDDVERFNITYLLIRRVLWTSEGKVRLADYAPVLYEYLKKHYPFVKEVGRYLVFCRQPL